MMKVCPFCAEEILSAAIFCKHCRQRVTGTDAVVPAKPLPFIPIPGAKSTSAWMYFFGIMAAAFVAGFVSGFTGSQTIMGFFYLFMFGSMFWVAFDASTHKFSQYECAVSSTGMMVVGTVLLWAICFPYYLGVRSRIRAGVQPVRVRA